MLFPHFDIVLASGSPRRKELLERMHPDFEVFVPDIDEEALTLDDPWETARRLAWAKASAVTRGDVIAIGADTVVALAKLPEGEEAGRIQLAKPKDRADAIRMLESLSGRRHAVITSVALIWPGGEHDFTCTSWVTFRELSRQEIEDYVATGDPMDKAGAYGIQSGAGAFVEEVEGWISTVIGLPYEQLELEMLSYGIADS